uniref:Uncharacterized protein n=1 Tax=Caenorhabditis japonica TaxID=281687 RepID=A0A8R1II12_CAEJA
MKKVITEALDVGEPYLIESINKTEVENVINTINQNQITTYEKLSTVVGRFSKSIQEIRIPAKGTKTHEKQRVPCEFLEKCKIIHFGY